MATYTLFKGFRVPSLASDPSSPLEGEVWYNTTTNLLKFYNGTTTKTVTTS